MKFIVYGQPTAKARPRFAKSGNFVTTYTDKKTSDYEALVRQSLFEQSGVVVMFNEQAQLEATIWAYYRIPRATTKKKIEQMINGQIRPLVKPDLDNIAKIILDSLNKILFEDDKQIIKLTIEKWYSNDPLVEIEIKER